MLKTILTTAMITAGIMICLFSAFIYNIRTPVPIIESAKYIPPEQSCAELIDSITNQRDLWMIRCGQANAEAQIIRNKYRILIERNKKK